MRRPWSKLWPDKMLVPEVFMLSERARSSYAWAFVLAARVEPGEPLREKALQTFTAIPLTKQRLALLELEEHGLVTMTDDTFTMPAFDDMQRPRSTAERMKALRERDVWGDGEGDVQGDAGVTKRNRGTEYTPGMANAIPPPGVESVPSRRRYAPVLLDANFGDLEPLVVSVLANDAAKRRDGKIADSVVDSLRQKLARHRDKHGVDALRHGLEVALDKALGVDYACGVAKHHKPGENGHGGPPERQYALLSIHDRVAE